MELFKSFNNKKYKIEIFVDPNPQNPREIMENLGVMSCLHSRYELGDKCRRLTTKDRYIQLPLYLYDHGGLSMSTEPFSCRWDSGIVGSISVSREKIKSFFGTKRLTQAIKTKVLDILKKEVEIYSLYLQGRVYGAVVTDLDNTDNSESCWGFYGEDFENNGLKEFVDEVTKNDVLLKKNKIA
jgi:hypothetical protein